MSGSLSLTVADRLLAEIARLAAERGPAELELPAEYERLKQRTDADYRAALKQVHAEHAAAREQAEREQAALRRGILEKAQADYERTAVEFDRAKHAAILACETAVQTAKKRLDEAQWEAATIFDARKGEPAARLKETLERLDAGRGRIEQIRAELESLLRTRRMWDGALAPLASFSELAGAAADPDAGRDFDALVEKVHEGAVQIAQMRTPRWFQGLARPGGALLLICLIFAAPAAAVLGRSGWPWIAAAAVLAGLVWSVGGRWLFRRARRTTAGAYGAWAELFAGAGAAYHRAVRFAEQECERQSREICERYESEMKRASDAFLKLSAERETRKQREIARLEEKYPPLLEAIVEERDRLVEREDKRRALLLERLEKSVYRRTHDLGRTRALAAAENDRNFKRLWGEMAGRWQEGARQFEETIDDMNRRRGEQFPDWNTSDWDRWRAPASIPPAVCFGGYSVDLGRIEHGVPKDPRLMPSRTEFLLPAALPFPERSLLLVKAGDDKAAAAEVLQSAMLRLLTSLPPGKVRFTIIDPVGLGEDFSMFMHLADYDEQLVASRIWTEASHIERRLADLTEHMETVIQVYLRNEFETIQQYNEFAGELAEPFRVLVIANFPAGFTEAAARRLTSIVTAGARCGIYTIISADPRQPMPRDFQFSDLERCAFSLVRHGGRFVWEHAQFGPLPLELDRPPHPERFTELVRAVGCQVKDADRVEVPFDNVAAPREAWWTEDSRRGIEVPLGRAGATKLQFLRLGQGTSQHVLIAGKTGSGKSTLLHALVVSSALRYSPDELEFYLIDFKKGVEFKAYAALELPHARVVAIESEREFGLSVLERLDLELRRRGDAFRRIGVQDVRGFRSAQPEARMPRILLIIDEFQELFVEEDSVAQSAALLLDRLVRQGRAFGIHVLLGSQTLAGAYSLARSTLGQMAVRIALQCSEADAHLILSEENTAARLLTRPGEAIYNDANGLFEGNHPFQVVWLPDHQREHYLRELREHVRQTGRDAPPPIVFEGNLPADLSKNRQLAGLLAGEGEPERVHAPRVWLGAAVAIKEPTSAVLLRQSGANLLLVGHREEAALGVLAASLISLAAQQARQGPASRFFVLDGTRADAPEAGYWPRFALKLGLEITVASPREAAAAIAEIDDEVRRREQSGSEDAPPIFLVIYDVGRFRELRRGDDDFGFSIGEEKPASTARQFANILREGPAAGVHSLLWCDSYNNVIRCLDRQGLRDVEYRVVFQMNAADSSNLIDHPAASRLGVHRAILYDEGRGTMEKFRPYGVPSEAWLAEVRGQVAGGRPQVAGQDQGKDP
jgi:S-DNA-T family DNA segregation ATPase FtsK/SpoIIIE